MASSKIVQSSLRRGFMGGLYEKLADWLLPTEQSKITDSDGHDITVTSSHGGRTSLNTGELYASKPVQDFLNCVTRDNRPNS